MNGLLNPMVCRKYLTSGGDPVADGRPFIFLLLKPVLIFSKKYGQFFFEAGVHFFENILSIFKKKIVLK